MNNNPAKPRNYFFDIGKVSTKTSLKTNNFCIKNKFVSLLRNVYLCKNKGG